MGGLSEFEGEFNLPSGPYAKRLKEFANCLNGAEKDRPFTLNDIAKKCGVNEQTVDSHVYQNLGELNKEMIVMGKKVNKVTITKEYRGLIVDPPQDAPGLSGFALLVGITGLLVGFSLLANRWMFQCKKCGVQINLEGRNQPSFACPECGGVYVKPVGRFILK
jgi:predicted Zn-ribbon and HTH transcriptional regulator